MPQSSKDDIYEANFFFRDYVGKKTSSICIGEVYLYFYGETLIGVRNQRFLEAWFYVIPIPHVRNLSYAPTLDAITIQDIQECIDEVTPIGTIRGSSDLTLIKNYAKEWLAAELKQ